MVRASSAEQSRRLRDREEAARRRIRLGQAAFDLPLSKCCQIETRECGLADQRDAERPGAEPCRDGGERLVELAADEEAREIGGDSRGGQLVEEGEAARAEELVEEGACSRRCIGGPREAAMEASRILGLARHEPAEDALGLEHGIELAG